MFGFPWLWHQFPTRKFAWAGKKKKKKILDFRKKLLDIWRSGLHSKDVTSGHARKTQQYKYSSQSIHLPILSPNGTQASCFVLRVSDPQ